MLEPFCLDEYGELVLGCTHFPFFKEVLSEIFPKDTQIIDGSTDSHNKNVPVNYYKDDNPANKPLLTWRAHANLLFSNWLNYYVYQTTPYNINEIKSID